MKFLTVVMFIFMVNVAASAINSLEITVGYRIQPQQDWIDATKTNIEDDEYFQSAAVQDTSSNFGFGDFVKGFAIFITTFAKGVVAPAYLFARFGLDTQMAVILSAPIYLLYGLGIAQFVANRGAKSME
jgi:hypothetical protein